MYDLFNIYCKGTTINGTMPVSYTHLDVYKRQDISAILEKLPSLPDSTYRLNYAYVNYF